MIRGPRPLRDHVATVTAYLNDYKHPHRTERELGEYSIYFTSYLISTCWPKMVRRIQSWQAMGFIYLLNSISVRQLEIFGWFWGGFQAGPRHGDKTLRSFLLNLKPQLKRLLASDRDENDRVLNYTEDDFPVMFRSDSLELIFSKKTISEFHRVTLAAFEGFAFTFMRLKRESRKLVSGIDY